MILCCKVWAFGWICGIRLLYNSVSSEHIFWKCFSERVCNICVVYCCLEQWSSKHGSRPAASVSPGNLRKFVISSSPQTHSETLESGPSHVAPHALQVILMHIQAEDHCQRISTWSLLKARYQHFARACIFIFQVTAPPEGSVTAEVRLSASGRGGIWVLVFMTPELCRSVC